MRLDFPAFRTMPTRGEALPGNSPSGSTALGRQSPPRPSSRALCPHRAFIQQVICLRPAAARCCAVRTGIPTLGARPPHPSPLPRRRPPGSVHPSECEHRNQRAGRGLRRTGEGVDD
jgi:hypothetical protein